VHILRAEHRAGGIAQTTIPDLLSPAVGVIGGVSVGIANNALRFNIISAIIFVTVTVRYICNKVRLLRRQRTIRWRLGYRTTGCHRGGIAPAVHFVFDKGGVSRGAQVSTGGAAVGAAVKSSPLSSVVVTVQ